MVIERILTFPVIVFAIIIFAIKWIMFHFKYGDDIIISMNVKVNQNELEKQDKL